MSNLPPPLPGARVVSTTSGWAYKQYAHDDICILVREPSEEEEKKKNRHDWIAHWGNAIAICVNFSAVIASLIGLSTKHDVTNYDLVWFAVAGFFIVGAAFMLGWWLHRGRVIRGSVEEYVNMKHWHRLYGRFLKDLTLNINGDLVAVWKRNELVIRKLKLWGDT